MRRRFLFLYACEVFLYPPSVRLTRNCGHLEGVIVWRGGSSLTLTPSLINALLWNS